ncbi:hypothetical protein GOV07_01995 [Candidatus Woesearchaeota archaeon]|nr:hypothetical protein [Candidatus Woesearchaeota archaeon]
MKDVSICPKCGSTNLKPATLAGTSDALPLGRGVDFNKSICEDCEYVGICPILPENEIDNFRKELKK